MRTLSGILVHVLKLSALCAHDIEVNIGQNSTQLMIYIKCLNVTGFFAFISKTQELVGSNFYGNQYFDFIITLTCVLWQ